MTADRQPDHASDPEPAADETTLASDTALTSDETALGRSRSITERAMVVLAAAGTIVVLGGTQGAYFPEMWGPSAVVFLALIGTWLAVGSRSDGGALDVVVVGLMVGLVAWTALGILWSVAPTQTILDAERAIAIVAALGALLVLARRRQAQDVATGIALGTTIVAGHGLATRLLPDLLVTGFDPIAGYRLSEPIGYWNGLGILSAIGILLAFGVVVDTRSPVIRVMGALAPVILAPTLYFTFSRGSWIALAVGTVSMIALSPRRLATIATLSVVAVAPALAVIASSHADSLTQVDATLAGASADGRDLLNQLLILGIVAAVGGVIVHLAHRFIDLGQTSRRILGAAVIVIAAGCLAGVFAKQGAPWTIGERAIDAFQRAPAAGGGVDLNDRLFDFSGTGRVDLWRVAIDVGRDNPLVGTGAGTYQRFWEQDERWTFKARDAHNLYLETLAEMGAVGLALLSLLLCCFVYGLVRARRSPTVPAAFGAFAAFAVHAGVDWDWEIPVITIAGLGAGLVGVIAARGSNDHRLPSVSRIAVAVLVVAAAGLSIVGFVGNDALARAQYALEAENPKAALSETRIAEQFAPWSPYPHTVAGEAHLALAETELARQAFRRALDIDNGYWRAWLGLAVASEGAARSGALARAKALYPRSGEIVETIRLLERHSG